MGKQPREEAEVGVTPLQARTAGDPTRRQAFLPRALGGAAGLWPRGPGEHISAASGH